MLMYINLDRSEGRREHMEREFLGCGLVRIPGIDGLQYSVGVDERGRYTWDEKCASGFVEQGLLGADRRYYPLSPMEFCCGLSHRKALEAVIELEDPWSLILEDDTMPLDGFDDFEMPSDCDFYSLVGADHPGDRIQIDADSNIVKLRNMSAYAITKHGAEVALKALTPLYCINDHQLSFRCFRNNRWKAPAQWGPEEMLIAKAPRVSLVGLASIAEITTFTSTGVKPWLAAGTDSTRYR